MFSIWDIIVQTNFLLNVTHSSDSQIIIIIIIIIVIVIVVVICVIFCTLMEN
jgi:flagellar basal body-associated protein FliL